MKESDTKKLVIGTITLAIAIVFFGGFYKTPMVVSLTLAN